MAEASLGLSANLNGDLGRGFYPLAEDSRVLGLAGAFVSADPLPLPFLDRRLVKGKFCGLVMN